MKTFIQPVDEFYRAGSDGMLTADRSALRQHTGEVLCTYLVPELGRLLQKAAEQLVTRLDDGEVNELTQTIAGDRLLANLLSFLSLSEVERGDYVPVSGITEASARWVMSYPVQPPK